MLLKFLGSTAAVPDPGEDCPCYLLNETVLIDCGMNVAGSLALTGTDMARVKTVFFTHLHHDHYIGLAALLFRILHKKPFPLNEFTVYGPDGDVQRVLERTLTYLQTDIFYADFPLPTVIGLKPGDCVQAEGMTVETLQSRHPVDGLCYRFTESDGTRLGISGDTAPLPEQTVFFTGCDALIHEATLAGGKPTEAPLVRACGHSSFREAVTVAQNSAVPVLFPVHMAVETAKTTVASIPAPGVRVELPTWGKTFSITKAGVTEQ